MSADGTLPPALALLAVVGTVVVAALRWDRWRLLARGCVAAASALSLAAAVALQVNRLTEAYPPVAAPAAVAATGSRLLTVRVAGRDSRLTLPMYVYLPAAYRTGHTRFPVIEALHGYPGSPRTWISKLNVQSELDREITSGRMAPTVVLFPYQTPRHLLDTECTNLVGGPQSETFLTADVPAYARAHFRVRGDRSGWALTGYSAGGFCAVNLALRHPSEYAAAAVLSGYASPGIRIGDGSENTVNNPAWRLRNLPRPPIPLWLGWAADDRGTRADSAELARLARPAMPVTTAVVPRGGHSDAVWQQMEPPAFDWLSAHLARPLP
ncbi:alpha/beta hydrolase family protein [Actinoplanes sp. N902-109]|uniref:alpha/beta hydrolase n=1 Tax=Actinoplanes sp. (strain N902-109) TaxID=649831 RepID=UPI00032957E7|nr:alpha/beta hydrolase-fold protein [Actinoplanes sp. N902-109]AGL16779.1 esterase [Actinoplanes sp. N902-109]